MAGGRPSKFDPQFTADLLAYFDVKCVEKDPVTEEFGAVSLPTLAGFACKIGVHRETLLNWANEHPEFFDALKMAKEHQERILVENGLLGRYDKTFAIFTAKNLINWRDKTEISGDGGGPVQITISAIDAKLL